VLLFILIAGVITYLSMQRAELATRLSRTNDELTATNEELLASEEEIRSHVDELYSAQQIITETKDRYFALFEAAGDAIFLHEIDADGMPEKFNEVNGRASESLGYTREELLGLTVIDIAGEKAIREAPDRMQELREWGHSIFESDHKRKDGSTFPVEVSSRVIGNPDETLILSVVRDITKRKAAENTLRLTTEKLQILSSITRHDILNHITTVLGFLDFAEGMSVDETQAKYLNRIKTPSKNIQRAIEFTREYENLRIDEPGWLQLTSLINKVSQEQIPITNDCQEVSIYADRMAEKVFYNLYDNTIRHAEGATGILIHCETDDGDLLIIWEDDGAGVPEEMKDRIFTRGFRKNTGFGLFLTREILAITTTTITGNGIPGKGARFEIRVRKGHFERAA
jgi:PAS domain S-box